jgi:hypothetical protein
VQNGEITTIEGNWGNAVQEVGPYDPTNPSPTHEHIFAAVAPTTSNVSSANPGPFPETLASNAVTTTATASATTSGGAGSFNQPLFESAPAARKPKTASVAPATSITTDGCTHALVPLYPGDMAAFRMGEVDLHFDFCPNTDQDVYWKATMLTTEINTPGTLVGLADLSADVYQTSSTTVEGIKFANYESDVTLKYCIPEVDWPCVGRDHLKATFQAVADPSNGKTWLYEMNNSTDDFGIFLWDTP